MSASPKQLAARMRASRIRSLRGLRPHLIEDPTDQQLFREIIDRQLASMGAETEVERRKRWQGINNWFVAGGPIDVREYERTGKPYTITEADIRRYTSW